MLNRTLLILFVIIITALSSITMMAQEDSTSETDPFQLTATQLIVDATSTASAREGEAQAIVTQSPNQGDPFALTATSIVAGATATAQFNIESGVYPTAIEDSGSPMAQTMVIFGLLIFVLIGLGGGYVLFASRNDDKRKLG